VPEAAAIVFLAEEDRWDGWMCVTARAWALSDITV
jgi:hypothetical protein